MKSYRLLLGAAIAALVLSCHGVTPAGHPVSSADHAGPRRVVMISLDGANAGELRRLYQAGKLTAGGFSRFFREGQVADHLIPVDPTLTATNHISLATGYPAGRTGIVGNSFHPPDKPLLETVSGFDAPIGTETLWEAARRQRKRVGTMGWPGADNADPRRRGDWGMTYINGPDRPPELVTIDGGRWAPAAEIAREHGIDSRSPARGVEVELGKDHPWAQKFELLAVDPPGGGAASLRLLTPESREGTPLAPGRWTELPCKVAAIEKGAPPRDAVCQVKLLAFDPAGETRIYFAATFALDAYPEDFAAELSRRKLYWPGPPDDHLLDDAWAGKPGIDLGTWSEESERFTRFFGDTLLAAARRPDWDLLMAYFPVIDEAGHELLLADPRQPGFSPERRDACERARLRVWQAVDRELARFLAAVDLRTTAVVVVSDHGMAPVHTAVDPNALLRDKGYLAVDAKGKMQEKGTTAYAVGSGGMVQVYVAPGHGDVVPVLRDLFTGWKVGDTAPVERAVTRQEAAGLGIDHPNAGDLILFLREGYGARNLLREKKASGPTPTLGMHGYLNTHPDMAAVYLALGAGIPRGGTGALHNPDVAGRVADLLGIEKPRPAP
jgi:predicted AlkP superfamily pyrophosphatase or phosphodiesterase